MTDINGTTTALALAIRALKALANEDLIYSHHGTICARDGAYARLAEFFADQSPVPPIPRVINNYQEVILACILVERERQEQLREDGKFTHTCASPDLSPPECLAVLAEEFGEVSKEVVEIIIAGRKLATTGDLTWTQALAHRHKNLRKELIQTAAVCVAWLESLDAAANSQ